MIISKLLTKFFFATAAIFILSGCATVSQGTTQTINIMTTANKRTKARVTFSKDTIPVLLPQAVSVKKSSKDLIITVEESECVLPSTIAVDSHLTPWFWGNMFLSLSGFLGSTTDSASGAMWEYDNNILVGVARKDDCK